MAEKISRRDFLRKSAVGLAGLTVVPSAVLGSSEGHVQPSDKLNIAGIGIGGKGSSDLTAVGEGMTTARDGSKRPTAGTENIVALCDVDWGTPGVNTTFGNFPNAKRYKDFRKMYDEMGKSIDAVVVATPDHTHCISAAYAISMGKHAFVQKPLTHSVYESRLLTKLAAKYNVATQMGNQGASGDGVAQICDWIWAGEIGEVTRVDAITNRPIWPQGLDRPTEVEPIPETLDWDLFIGPAPMRPYNKLYHPWNWRGWWDFGTGALGDMACHILHPAFKALELGYPAGVLASSTTLKPECAPQAEIAYLRYPARTGKHGRYPEVRVSWYDGGLKPERPKGFPEGRNLMDAEGGVLFHGTKDTLWCGCYGRNPMLLSGRTPSVPQLARRVPNQNPYADWIRACKESAANRTPTNSDFAEAGPFNETVVMGAMAVRLQALNKELLWDGPNMRFTNIGPEETLRMDTSSFTVEEGHPMENIVEGNTVNVQRYAAELVKRTYRSGWILPEMP